MCAMTWMKRDCAYQAEPATVGLESGSATLSHGRFSVGNSTLVGSSENGPTVRTATWFHRRRSPCPEKLR